MQLRKSRLVQLITVHFRSIFKKLHVSMTILKIMNLWLEEEPLLMQKSAASLS